MNKQDDLTEYEKFDQWWNKRMDKSFELTLTEKERFEGKKRSKLWGESYKREALAAWIERSKI